MLQTIMKILNYFYFIGLIVILLFNTVKIEAQNTKLIKGKVFNYTPSVAMVTLNTSEGLKTSNITADGEFEFVLSNTTPINQQALTINPVRNFEIISRNYNPEGTPYQITIELKTNNTENPQISENEQVTVTDPTPQPEIIPPVQDNNTSLKRESGAGAGEDELTLENTARLQDSIQRLPPNPPIFEQKIQKLDTMKLQFDKIFSETRTIEAEINQIKKALDSPELTEEEKDKLREKFEELKTKLDENMLLLKQIQAEIDKITGRYIIEPTVFYSILGVLLVLLALSIFYFIIAGIRKKSEQELAKSNDELKETVAKLEESDAELNAKIEEVQLQAEELSTQRDKLIEIQTTKDILISAVNHDLRNPLNPIINFSNPDYQDDDKENLLSRIHAKSKRMNIMIADIMDVYRADKVVILPERNNFYQTTQEAINELKDFQEEMPLIENQIDPNLEGLFAKKYIERVLENLLSNAIKYAPSGKITFTSEELDYQFNQKNTPQKAIKISVTDTGEGISEEDLQNIFEPFVNPNAKVMGRVESVGLGLAFCKMIVEMHHSQIEVKSKLGKGTTFSFVLPKYEPIEAPISEEATPNDYHFNKEEKAYLTSIIEKMRAYSIYEDKLRDIVEEIDDEAMPNLSNWKNEVLSTIDGGIDNEDKLEILLSKI